MVRYETQHKYPPGGSFFALGVSGVPILWHWMAISVVKGLTIFPTKDSRIFSSGPKVLICVEEGVCAVRVVARAVKW